MWIKYEGGAQGVQCKGDKTVSPTRWWNHTYYVLFGWKVVTVFEVPVEYAERGYRVGYRPETGAAMLEDQVLFTPSFRVKHGHEDCTFFAISGVDGKTEVPIKATVRAHKNDKAYKDAPLR